MGIEPYLNACLFPSSTLLGKAALAPIGAFSPLQHVPLWSCAVKLHHLLSLKKIEGLGFLVLVCWACSLLEMIGPEALTSCKTPLHLPSRSCSTGGGVRGGYPSAYFTLAAENRAPGLKKLYEWPSMVLWIRCPHIVHSIFPSFILTPWPLPSPLEFKVCAWEVGINPAESMQLSFKKKGRGGRKYHKDIQDKGASFADTVDGRGEQK